MGADSAFGEFGCVGADNEALRTKDTLEIGTIAEAEIPAGELCVLATDPAFEIERDEGQQVGIEGASSTAIRRLWIPSKIRSISDPATRAWRMTMSFTSASRARRSETSV
jgi:hypothetical protein